MADDDRTKDTIIGVGRKGQPIYRCQLYGEWTPPEGPVEGTRPVGMWVDEVALQPETPPDRSWVSTETIRESARTQRKDT